MSLRRHLGLLFCVSGATALVYEVIWSRMLGLVLGSSAHAVATVLAVFMGGLALGAALAGKLADRTRSPLLLYAGIELLIGLYALLSGLLLRELPALYVGIAPQPEAPLAARIAVRCLLSSGVLLVPCLLMGATLPVLSRALVQGAEDPRKGVALLYAANTLGAALGCAGSGFLLAETLGLQGTLWLAAAGNLLVAAWALRLHRRLPPREPARLTAPATPRSPGRAALLPITVTGFTALACEILWARFLTIYVGNSVYAFSYMLGVFLAGLALGSYLVPARSLGASHPLGSFGRLQLAIALAVLVSLLALLWPVPVEQARGEPVVAALGLRFLVTTVLMGLQPVLFGAAFPLLVQGVVEDPERVGRNVGLLYGMNTLGNILGAVLVGFLLIPLVGILDLFLLLAGGNALCGACLSLRGLPPGARGRRLLPAITGLLVLAGFLWLPRDLLPAFYARQFGTLVAYEEGASDTIMVVDTGERLRFGDAEYPGRWLYFSDRRGTAGTASLPGNILYAQIPMLLHPSPRRVLVICFGSGNTAASAASHPAVQVDVVDISPEVFHLAPYFPTNHGVHDDPRVHYIAEDGRNYLLATDREYEVITLEPPFLDMAGVVNLYTVEFYQQARRRLGPDGLLAQWFPLETFGPEETELLLRSFLEVFPRATVWEIPLQQYQEWLLVGSVSDTEISLPRMEAALQVPSVAADLARIGIDSPEDLLRYHLFPGARLARLIGEGELVTDDRSRVDYSLVREKLRYKLGMRDPREQQALVYRMALERELPAVAGELAPETASRLLEAQRARLEALTGWLRAHR